MLSFWAPPDSGISTSSRKKPGKRQASFLSILRFMKFQFGCIVIALGYLITLSCAVLPLELFSFLLIKPLNLSIHRKISSFLHLSMCSHLVVMSEWWCNTKIQIFVDPQDLQLMRKEHTILLVNHRCATEHLVIASLANHIGTLGNLRAFMKKSLSHLPILGWVWTLQENIYLERNFEKDKVKLGKQLLSLFGHSDPFSFIFFPEGTRFSTEKHATSMAIAKEKGLPVLKHHLLPRTKGFVTIVENLKKIDDNKNPLPVSIVDVLVFIDFKGSKSSTWTFSDALQGQGADVKVVLRRYPVKDITFGSTNDEGECSMWLQKIYQEKDKLMQNLEDSQDSNFFSNAKEALPSLQLPKSWNTLLFVIFWDLVLLVPIISRGIKILFYGTCFQMNLVLGSVFVINFVYNRLINDKKRQTFRLRPSYKIN